MAERGRAEEVIATTWVRDHLAFWVFSLGLIDIPDGPIRWIVVCKDDGQPGQSNKLLSDYYINYGVSDPRLEPKFPRLLIESTRKKNYPLVGRVVDLRWEGKDSGLGVIGRLNSDISIKEPIMRSRDVKIRIHRHLRCWIISTKTWDVPSPGLWNCYQAIAQHLLAEWEST